MGQDARLQEQVIFRPSSEVKACAALQEYEAVCCSTERKEAFREVEGFMRRTSRGEALFSGARRHVGPTLLESAPVALGESEGEATRAVVLREVVLRKDVEITQNLFRHVHLEHGPVATLAEVTFVDGLPKTRSGSAPTS